MTHLCMGHTRFTQEIERCRKEIADAELDEHGERGKKPAYIVHLTVTDWECEALLIEAEAQQQAQGVGA